MSFSLTAGFNVLKAEPAAAPCEDVGRVAAGVTMQLDEQLLYAQLDLGPDTWADTARTRNLVQKACNANPPDPQGTSLPYPESTIDITPPAQQGEQ